MLPAKEDTDPWGFSDVVVRGKLGPRGHYGNLGSCTHMFEVTELVKVSNMRGPDR